MNANPLSDVRVRQAIAYAIDRNLIVESVFGGYAVPADGLLPNGPFKSPNLERLSVRSREGHGAPRRSRLGWQPHARDGLLLRRPDHCRSDGRAAGAAGRCRHQHDLRPDRRRRRQDPQLDPRGPEGQVGGDLGHGLRRPRRDGDAGVLQRLRHRQSQRRRLPGLAGTRRADRRVPTRPPIRKPPRRR